MYVYLLYLLIFFAVPVIILGWVQRKELVRYRRTVFWCLLFVYTVGWFWDWLAFRTGVWRYDSAETVGIWVDGIPVEEFIGFYILGTLLLVNVTFMIVKIFSQTRSTNL